MSNVSELELAKEIWEDCNGDLGQRLILDLRTMDSERKLKLENLLRKGVIKKYNNAYGVSITTKKFIENDGMTDHEIEKIKEEERKDLSLKYSKRANIISTIALFISLFGVIIAFSK
ncbi:hypothetical protein MWH25_12390 [Natroniella acetigena]|uniref:hypothetical protein n=1 Tax=Natroniella acetigena TaxID=52004 RepID=UPI00200B6106|nr:hypothetical protein [Natroniella acetigena]MCK8828522.1 hypothetical protein [Natroniella acetigena]